MAKYQASQTHCKAGHEFTAENTYVSPVSSKRACRICRAETTKQAKTRHPEKEKKTQRKSHLKLLGWTPELFAKVIAEQNGKCAVCDKVLNFEKRQNDARACADHEHTSPPKPRGILCSVCNTALGLLKEDPVIMRAMIEYTLKHREGG